MLKNKIKGTRLKGHLFIIALLLFSSIRLPFLYADHLTSSSLQALDSALSARSPAVFNNSEKIGFSYTVSNSRTQAGFIQFTFGLTDPNGVVVFKQEGNSAAATQTGSVGASISGIPVSDFFTVPGTYQLKGTAKFSDNSESVSATLDIEIYSPVLNLTYPPDSSRDLRDQPLIFRWTGTGATKYKVIVSLYPSLYDPILTSETSDSQFSYPTNPSDVRQRLSSGQIYYWSVEGLDTSGTKVSEPAVPYSFSIAGSAVQAQAKDLAIIDLEESKIQSDIQGKMSLDVIIKNQGGRTESNVTVLAFIQGELQGKQTITSISPSEEKRITFSILPSPRTERASGFLVSTLLEGFFDDNLLNNSFTKQIAWPSLAGEKIEEKMKDKRESQKEEKKLEKDGKKEKELKQKVMEIFTKLIPPKLVKELEGYEWIGMDEGITENEMNEILLGIEKGTVKVLDIGIE